MIRVPVVVSHFKMPSKGRSIARTVRRAARTAGMFSSDALPCECIYNGSHHANLGSRPAHAKLGVKQVDPSTTRR